MRVPQTPPRIDLRKNALEALPSKALSLLETIENFAEREVRFTSHDALPGHLKYPGYKSTTPYVALDHIAATVILPSEIEPHGIVHELLHIHRYWVEGVPQCQPIKINPQNRSYIGGNENLLEHLTIAPREAEYGFDRSVWNGFARKKWEDYPWPNFPSDGNRRVHTLRAKLETDLADDPAIHQLGRECLRAEGLEDEADKFSARTKELLHNKPRLVACTVRFFKIPRHAIRLVYFDVRKGEERFESVPNN
jgi:hypothetical protein